MRCIHCNEDTYLLKNGHRKCKKCKKKFSPQKINKDIKIIEYFCEDFTAKESAKKLSLNYVTVKRKFDTFRKIAALYLEKEYENKKEILEFEEYLYLEKSKRGDKKNIFDAYNFITFDYGGKIYNILMPDLSKYKNSFLQDGLQEVYYKEFERFLKLNKIIKLKSKNNLLKKFWLFFENSITKYKGVNRENFFYYLKECEFKFNYPLKCKEILKKLYFNKYF